MALIRTMGTVVGLCQRRADKETDEHVDTDEVKELISEVYGELHGAVSEVGSRYFETEDTISADGSATYDLPIAHLSTIGVDRVVDAAGRRTELAQLMVQERTVFAGQTGDAYMFALTGTNIALYPTPASGTYKHIYVPQPTDYSTVGNGEQIDFINQDGLRFVIWGVASIMRHKGEDDQLRAMRERDAARERLVAWAVQRALTMPKRRIVNEVDLDVYGGGRLLSPADWRLTR